MCSVTSTERPLIEFALGSILAQEVVYEGRWLRAMLESCKFEWNSESWLPAPGHFVVLDDLHIYKTLHEKIQEIDVLPAIEETLGSECRHIEEPHDFVAGLILVQALEREFCVDWQPFWNRFTMSGQVTDLHKRCRFLFFKADYETLRHHIALEVDHFFDETPGQLLIEYRPRLRRKFKQAKQLYARFEKTSDINIKTMGEMCFKMRHDYDWETIAGIVLLQEIESLLGLDWTARFWKHFQLHEHIIDFKKRFVVLNLL